MLDFTWIETDTAAALKLAGQPKDFHWQNEPDDADLWIFGSSMCPNSGDILPESNYRTILADLEAVDPDNVIASSSSHWLVGTLDQILVKAIDTNTGMVTPAACRLLWIMDKLDGYPIFDETDYSERESERTWENLQKVVESVCNELDREYSETLAIQVHRYLSDHNPNALESVDDRGGWPSDEDVIKALETIDDITPYARAETAGQPMLLDIQPWSTML